MKQVLDSTAPFDFFSKNGYYTINDKIALHIGVACQEATRTRHPIQWHFNDDAFASIDWTQSWRVPIGEVYRRRAQQLRDKYNYIILAFSGGADSTTILESFLYNNIHLDEVIVSWPFLSRSNLTPTNNPDTTNYHSEWHYSIKPKLDWVAKHHPAVKITVLDQLAIEKHNHDFDDKWTMTEYHNFGALDRQISIDRELCKRQETIQDVVLITGSSPPRISLLNNRYLAVSFNSKDSNSGMGKSDYMAGNIPRNVEAFYWTPDMPELVREQAHIILDHLNKNFRDRQLFATYNMKTLHRDEKMTSSFFHNIRRELIKKLVYPNWITGTFQAFKNTSAYCKTEAYQPLLSSTADSVRYLQSWQYAIDSQYALIDQKFIWSTRDGIPDKDSIVSFPVYFSKFYVVGQLLTTPVN
jgi:hypothetical protein